MSGKMLSIIMFKYFIYGLALIHLIVDGEDKLNLLDLI